MRRSIQLLTLHCAIVVTEEGSFLRASRRLRIHHSALSRRIKDLELRLGVTLFERHPGGVRATAAGVTFLAKIRRILKDLDDTLQEIEPADPAKSEERSVRSDTLLCNCAFLNAVVGFLDKDPDVTDFIEFLRKRHPAP
ncbi:LysR family transcriptional regulator [Mesorhizobium sp. WSM3224]|uniref:LysR family transcriptional regulator n=1 Tax=Mesorhizobium sp. WSM3224 TaxID=1040986 RepID=UPI000A00B03D|nr:LysR family transcriptional regulator [Mesorhizobium sp. WSM3224]